MTNSLRLAVGAAVGCVLLAACSPSIPSPTPAPANGESLSPTVNQVYKCLLDKGWKPILHRDGGIEMNSDLLPDAQLDLYDADSKECWAVIRDRIAQMQPDEIAGVYELELETRACLIEFGLEVDEPPSEQSYIDTFHGQRWTAYGASNVQSVSADDEKWLEVNESCPQPSWSLGVL